MKNKENNRSVRLYRCAENVSENDDRIDSDMKKILQVLNGQKSLASIAFASGIGMSEFQKAIKTLIDLELIIPIDLATTNVD